MTEFMKFRKLIMYIVLILVVFAFFRINYTDLSFKANKSEYIGILSGLLMILALYFSNKREQNKVE